ncbi:MAG: hypothetical protein IT427_16245 [Pirellulales bacterium]|nr:hypothetical protein [Pirellulales bacterium]
MEKKNRPCYEQRLGNIRVAIWENVNEKDGNNPEQPARKWYNVAITRRFRTSDGWKEAPTLNGLGDLAQAASAIRLAEEWINARSLTRPTQDEATA